MARTVEDAAYLMDIIADGPKIGRSYSSGLKTTALDGVKLLVPENLWDWEAPTENRQVRLYAVF